METKICCKCGVEKPKNIENYYFNKNKNIFVGACKACVAEKRRKYYKENREIFLTRNKKWREENPDKVKQIKRKEYENNKERYSVKTKEYRKNNIHLIKERNKKYYEKNKEIISKKMKTWRDNNKNYQQEYNKKYKQENKEKLNDWNREYRNERRKNDVLFKIKDIMRNNVNRWLNGKKLKKTEKIIGLSVEDFKKHIENQFQPGMSWDNWGKYGWHLDHIIPLSSATNDEEVYKLNHYTNLQPLWAKDNLSKGAKTI